jgi:hypothetical protein
MPDNTSGESETRTDRDDSADGTNRCERCGEHRETTTLYRDGHIWGVFCLKCHDAIAEFAAGCRSEQEVRG